MKLSSRHIASILYKLSQKPRAKEYVRSFLDALEERRLAYLFERIPRHLKHLAEEEEKLRKLELLTRFPLGEDEELFLSRTFHIDREELKRQRKHDESLLGGLLLQKDGVRRDASLRRQLRALKKHIQS